MTGPPPKLRYPMDYLPGKAGDLPTLFVRPDFDLAEAFVAAGLVDYRTRAQMAINRQQAKVELSDGEQFLILDGKRCCRLRISSLAGMWASDRPAT